MAEYPPSLSASDKNSFAYPTIKDRNTVIVAKIADYLSRNRELIVNRFNCETSQDELKTIIGAMSCLRHEVMTNKPVVPLRDSNPDAMAWNIEIAKQQVANGGEPLRWFNSPWLWMECYLYRRIHEAVMLSKCFQTLDVFQEQKQSAFLGSYKSISALTSYLQEIDQLNQSEEEMEQRLKQFLQISLWGNKCDLSFSSGEDSNPTENPLDQLTTLLPNILINDMDNIFQLFMKKQSSTHSAGGAKVSIVLDNAGFEYVTDLCLAEYLLSSGLATQVHFHGKAMPWFVSDVTQQDVTWTFETMYTMNNSAINSLVQKWEKRIKNGSMVFQFHPFWTMPYAFNEMENVCPDLYHLLSLSDLVIFKGDLNYRKLVGDLKWQHVETFSHCLRGFHPTNVCSLRTSKADVFVGLKSGQAEEIAQKDDKWMVSGNWGLISLHQQS